MRGYAVKTPENVAKATAMRTEGKTWREIGEHFGVHKQTVHAWVADPDGRASRARKDSHARPCVDCGGPSSGWKGVREEPRCLRCSSILRGAECKIWTRDAILLAMEEWAAQYGDYPATRDWNPWSARYEFHDEERAQRFEAEDGNFPTVATVIREFGSWNDAIKTAGFKPRAPHGGGGNGARHRSVRERTAA